jgi:hypothetical protein
VAVIFYKPNDLTFWAQARYFAQGIPNHPVWAMWLTLTMEKMKLAKLLAGSGLSDYFAFGQAETRLKRKCAGAAKYRQV